MSEAAVISSVSAANVRAHVEHICNTIPSRLAGSANGKRMAEYSRSALLDCGVDSQIHEMPGLVSYPEQAEMRVLAPVELAIEANTFGHSVPTPPEGFSGELIDVASGSFEDYDGKNAVGKLTLSELSYHPARHEKQRIAGLMGSVGCVMMNWGGPDNTAVPFGSVKPAWGNPTPQAYRTEMPTLPCIGIARTAGLKLREMIRSGLVRVWIRANVENRWAPVHVTTGRISTPSVDDFVIVGGHQDSWYGAQATDNAAGNACTMELARVFNLHRDKLRRGLLFGFWTGHETGTMVGSSWYVDRHWENLRDHAVAYLQIDQPACAGTSRWLTTSNIELRRFHQAIEQRMLANMPVSWRRAVKIGDASFFGLGVPMLTALGGFTEEELKATALANLGWWHHSLDNTLDKLDWDFMQLHLRTYAAYLWELCTAPILPFEFVSVADQFIDRLEQMSVDGKAIALDGAYQQALEFRSEAQRLDEIVRLWDRRYRAAEVADEGPAQALNSCLKRLSRTLIPLASTSIGKYGHDPYGYTPQGTMIPSLFDVARLHSAGADSEERWMLETQLIRARNRLVDTLFDCRTSITQTLRSIS